jgi:hypothetical protein
MPSLSKTLEDEKQLTLDSEMCKSGNYFPHIHPSEVRNVTSRCSGRHLQDIVTCQDAGREEFVEDVGGLDMLGVKLHETVKSLPTFIPIIPRGLFKYQSGEISSKIVGIILNDILTKKLTYNNGYLAIPEGTDLNADVLRNPVFQGKRVILFSTGPDILIETLWWNRQRQNFFQKISEMGFTAVTGMNFSVFRGECPFAHALNIKKSLCYCMELEEYHVRTIPHIYAINDFQRKRWGKWLSANPLVRTVTINTQLQGREMRGMGAVYNTVQFLLKNTAVKIIVHGSMKGLNNLLQMFPNRIHRAASGPLKNAIIRKDKTAEEYIQICRRELERPRLLRTDFQKRISEFIQG